MNKTFIKPSKLIVRTSKEDFSLGWQMGYDWIMKNYYIGSDGLPNCWGDFLQNFCHLSDRIYNGVPEGVRYGLSDLRQQFKNGKKKEN
jgi:hypothetical protein